MPFGPPRQDQLNFIVNKISTQEWIPVVCIPAASMATSTGGGGMGLGCVQEVCLGVW